MTFPATSRYNFKLKVTIKPSNFPLIAKALNFSNSSVLCRQTVWRLWGYKISPDQWICDWHGHCDPGEHSTDHGPGRSRPAKAWSSSTCFHWPCNLFPSRSSRNAILSCELTFDRHLKQSVVTPCQWETCISSFKVTIFQVQVISVYNCCFAAISTTLTSRWTWDNYENPTPSHRSMGNALWSLVEGFVLPTWYTCQWVNCGSWD